MGKKKQTEKQRNLVAKHMERFCRNEVHKDQTKYSRKVKHKNKLEE